LTLQFKTTLMVNKKSYYIIKFGWNARIHIEWAH
jgi:hypothetical protein